MSFEKVENVTAEEITSTVPVTSEKKYKAKSSIMQSVVASIKSLPIDKQLSTLLSKYEEIAEENLKLLTTTKSQEKNMKIVRAEKKKLEQENNKYILAKSRLESLCRELQKQNKLIKDENVCRLKEEEVKRKEVSDQLHKTLVEISQLMEENTQRNSKLKVENENMSARLQDLVKQHQDREERVEKAIEQKQLEVQLSEARLAKTQLEFTGDKEKLLREKKNLLQQLGEYQKKVQNFSATELTLRAQLSSYSEKYEEFQGTLDKSNQVFKTFKSEMDEMSKNIKRHEKETRNWKQKWENANKALLQMVNDRTQMQSKIDFQDKQLTKLQSLCRALQKQNTELRAEAKKEGLQLIKKIEENKENGSVNLNRESSPQCDSTTSNKDLDIETVD